QPPPCRRANPSRRKRLRRRSGSCRGRSPALPTTATRRAVAASELSGEGLDTCSFLALRDWQLAKKSLHINPKFGLSAPAHAASSGDRRPPTQSGDEFGPEFTTDAPNEAALAWISGREDQREFRRGLEMLGDDFDAAVRNVRDHAVTRQGPGPELDLRE